MPGKIIQSNELLVIMYFFYYILLIFKNNVLFINIMCFKNTFLDYVKQSNPHFRTPKYSDKIFWTKSYYF